LTIADPTDAIAYVRAIRMIVGGYGAYSREKRRETDVAVREELARAVNRIRRHLENVHDAALTSNSFTLVEACSRAIEECDALRNEVSLAETGCDHPFFSVQKGATKKTIGTLIRHDHATLKMVTKAVRSSNQAEKLKGRGAAELAVLESLNEVLQRISSCRGHFGERRAVLRNLKVM